MLVVVVDIPTLMLMVGVDYRASYGDRSPYVDADVGVRFWC